MISFVSLKGKEAIYRNLIYQYANGLISCAKNKDVIDQLVSKQEVSDLVFFFFLYFA